jgi:ABC-type Na+ efflux pump permease subunit
MKNILLTAQNEFLCFCRSDRGILIVYSVLVLVWSALLASNMHQLSFDAGAIWLIFFSVIVSGNFANTTFVSERLNGSLEIILTCGVSRMAILLGKMLFILAMSAISGFVCYLLALAAAWITGLNPFIVFKASDAAGMLMLYISACYMNTTCGAWLSLRLANPRLSQFTNLVVLGVIVGAHTALSAFTKPSPWLLPSVLILLGTLFLIVAVKDFKSERIIQPLSM